MEKNIAERIWIGDRESGVGDREKDWWGGSSSAANCDKLKQVSAIVGRLHGIVPKSVR